MKLFSKDKATDKSQKKKKSQLRDKQNLNGAAFELFFWDWLTQIGVPPHLIHLQVKHKRTNADCDFIVGDLCNADTPLVGVMVKTSFRERWKQLDRDAILFKRSDVFSEAVRPLLKTGQSLPRGKHDKLTMWALTYKEHAADTAVSAQKNCENKGHLCEGFKYHNVITVLDTDAMSQLRADVLTAVGKKLSNAA